MDIIESHKYCINNKKIIKNSKNCGCFYCLEIFNSNQIEFWTDDGNTALCPKCGIDSILGDDNQKLDKDFLKKMKEQWFNNSN